MKLRKLIAIVSIFAMLFHFIPPPVAKAQFISDPTDLGYLTIGHPINVDGNQLNFYGYWEVTVNDANGTKRGSAKDVAVAEDYRPESQETEEIYNYVAKSVMDDWIDLLKGDHNYVDNKTWRDFKTLSANNRNSERIHIRDLAEKCGAWVQDYDANAKTVTVQTTPLPSCRISYDGSTKEGDTETFRVFASGYAAENSGINSWKFKIDGKTIDKGGDTRRLAESVTHTFNDSGTYTATLEVTDNVGREATDIITVTVGAGTTPPDPPTPEPPTGGPNASFDMPSSTEVGESVTILNTSTASDGHSIEDVDWDVEGNYTGSLADHGGTITFTEEGVYDVTLTVEDDQGKTDSRTKTIIVEEQPPPPPPPNEEPTAEFDMPSHAKQGDTVDVINLSTDDGEIVDVDWDISPSSGYTEDLDDSGGTITFNEEGEYTVELTVEDDDGATDSETDTIEVENKPPRAEIDIPDEILQGQDITIECDSYDPDGEIVNRTWTVTPEGMIGEIKGKESTVYFDKDKEYTIELTVEDEFGKTDTATETLTVKPAIPEAYYDWSGTPKQNRKVTFDASGNQSSDRYPIIWEQTQWEFVTPAGVTQDAVKIASTGDLSKRQVLFKEPGDYTVRLAVKNTAGHTSEWYEKTISIQPDKPPVVDFKVSSAFLRNPDNNNKAAIELIDNSYSPDGDVISKRVWTYRYDSDNDGSFTDETWHTLDNGNNPTPVLYTKDVGKYQFELYVEESFGQDTLLQFVTEDDKRSGDTSSKPINEKITEVINRQPVVNFDAITKKKVDIIFSVGEVEGDKLDDLQGKITRNLESKLSNANIHYGTIKSVIASDFSSNDADAGLIFNSWKRYGYNKDSWRYDSSNNTIERKDNSYWAGFYDPNFNSNNYTIEVEGTGGSDTDDIGVTFAMKDGEFYTYNLDGYGNGPYPNLNTQSHNHGTGVYKAEFGSDYVNLTEAVEKGSGKWLANQFSKIKVKVEGTQAKIYLDGELKHTLNDPDGFEGSFGVYTNSTPNGRFKNLTVTSKKVKTLDEILKEPDWRDDAQHFIVNISDKELPGLNDPKKASVIYSRLLNDEIHYCMMGTSNNINQTQEVIDINDGRGKFVYNSNMDSALDNIADYIINEVNKKQGKKVQYVLLNEEIEYKTYYKDKENDPEIERRWKYSHDPYYFDNSLGKVSYDKQFIPAPVKKFSKTGKFETVFQAKDNPKDDDRFNEYRKWSYMPQDKLNIYVHRRPKALYSCTFNISQETNNYQQSNIDFSNEDGYYAYWNPQFEAPEGETIKTIEFKTPRADDDEWRNNLLVQGYRNGSWQTIRDYESSYEWSSSPVSDTINVSGQGYTKVKFNFSMYDSAGSAYGSPDNSYYKITTEKTINSGIQYNDYSYDPDHQTEGDKGIVQHEWMWKEIGSYSTSTNNYQQSNIDFSNEDGYYAYWNPQFEAPEGETIKTIEFKTPRADDDEWRNNLLVQGYRNGSWQTIRDYESSYEWSSSPVSDTINVSGQGYTKVKFNFSMYDSADSAYGDPDNSYYKITTEKNVATMSVTDWNSGKLNNIEQGKIYLVSLRVKDKEGVWSYRNSQVLSTINDNMKPIAQFKVAPNPAIQGQDIQYTDNSYDPDGDSIVDKQWRYRKEPDGNWNSCSTPPSSFSESGDYRVELKVFDGNSWSEPFYQVVHVKEGNKKPVANFEVSPDPAPVSKKLSYTDKSSDPDGDPIIDEEWRWKKSGSSEWHYGKPFTPKDLVTEIKRADEIAQGQLSGQGPIGNVISIQENKGSTLITFHSSPHVEGQLAEQNAEIITLSFEGSEVNTQSGFFTADVLANSGANKGGWDGIQIEGRPESITFTNSSPLNVFVNNNLYATGKSVTYYPTGSYVDQDIELGDYVIAKRVKDMPSMTDMTALWSDWHEETIKVIEANEKPIAQFSVIPDPVSADEEVTYNDNSFDPDGVGISKRIWRVETKDGTLLGEYVNSKPPKIFKNTGWGDMGAGEYRIGLRVKDVAPNPYVNAKWSDWTWHNLQVVIPLQGSGEIIPDPAPSGYNVEVTIDTEGYADEVIVKFPNDSYFNGDEITLTPQDLVNNKYNTFKGNYKTDIETPDGTYNVTATVKRTNVAPQTITVPLTLAIQGDIYDQVKVRKKDAR